jgi:serine/threonine protein kinase
MTSQASNKRPQDIRNEVELCVSASHDHILAFLGTCLIDGHVHWVSPYISNGNLAEYLKKNPLFDRVRMVSHEKSCRPHALRGSISQLRETADAVAYLHSIQLVHGDIKANNILVGDLGEARICGFGLSKIMQSRALTTYKGQGNVRWQAPELFDNQPKSFETDVYAFGITIFEVRCGSLGTPNNVNLVGV